MSGWPRTPRHGSADDDREVGRLLTSVSLSLGPLARGITLIASSFTISEGHASYAARK